MSGMLEGNLVCPKMILTQHSPSNFPDRQRRRHPINAPLTRVAPVAERRSVGSGPSPIASQQYIGELDGIRAVAVALVVVAHYGLRSVVPGGFGVTLFFFLSGYLITTLFFAEYRETAGISIPQFYMRRWLRLTPPLIISVLLGVIFYPITRNALDGSPMPIGATLAALFYYTNYYDLYHNMAPFFVIPFGICWSLAVEEHFYLVWPWIIRQGIGNPRRLCLFVAVSCVAVLTWRCVARYVLAMPTDYTYLATDCRIDSILYGAMLRILFEFSWSTTTISLLRLPISRILAVLALLSTFVIRNDNFRETFRYSIQGVALMPFFVAVLVDEPNTLMRRALASAPMVLVGRLSYSIYLFHFLARSPGEVYFGSQQRVELAISGLLLTGLISYVLFIFVERPIARLRHRLRAKARSVGDAPANALLAEVPGVAVLRDPTRGS
jgi:peptidoglycan/LPS O-acetylase OafA/YrhL